MKQFLFVILIAIIACQINLGRLKGLKMPAWANDGEQYIPNYHAKLTQYFKSAGVLDDIKELLQIIGPDAVCKECWPEDSCIEFMKSLAQNNN